MGKIIVYSFQGTFIIVVLLSIYSKISELKNMHLKIDPSEITMMPSFAFETLQGDSFTENNLDYCVGYLLIYFNSECENCIKELRLIDKSIDKFQNTQIVFISTQSREDIITLIQEYQLFSRSNVRVLFDVEYEFANLFKASSYPTIFVFDYEKKLVERIDHPIGIKSLLKITQYASRGT